VTTSGDPVLAVPVVSPPTGAERSARRGLGALPLRWLGQRILLGLATLVVISMVIFVVTRLLPGDAASTILGQQATPDQVASLRHELGLDRPIAAQYWSWVSGIFHGDLGESLSNGIAVSSLLVPRLVNSLMLVAYTAIIAVPLAFAIGSLAARASKGVWDHVVNGVSIFLLGMPQFVIAILLILLFATSVFHWLPAISMVTDGSRPFTHPAVMVLPVATLVLNVLPYLVRMVRASVASALGSDYVTAARLRGVPPSLLLRRHALRNAIVPSIQGVGLTMAYLLGGVVVIEFLFQYPGLGSLLTTAVSSRDLPVVQTTVLTFSAAYIAINIVTDLCSMLLSPRTATQ